MKRYFLAGLIVLLAALLFVYAVKNDPGYILISYDVYTLETSLTVGVISLVVLCVLLYSLLHISWRFITGTVAFNRWFNVRRYRRSRQKTAQGIIAYIEGNWSQSRRLLAKAADNSETPLINYLFAAWASNELREDDKTRELLRLAGESTSGAAIAVEIAQAEMQIDRGYLERSLATLTRARQNAHKYPYVYKLLQQVYIGLKDWDGLAALLPELKKYNVIAKEELQALTERCCQQQLQAAANQSNKEDARVALLALWRQQSKATSRNSELVKIYAECLVAAGDEAEAEKVLRQQLNREWSEALVDLYGKVQATDTNKQLLHAENWLKERNNDARLFLCLGRLSLRNQLWGKAKEYFETSHKLQASSEACAELGRLLAKLGKHEQSNAYFHQGLLMSTHGLPELPMPGKSS